MNRGKGVFKLLDAEESGVDLDGQIRDIQEIKGGSGKQLLFLRNDMLPVLFQQGKPTIANKRQ